MIKFLDLNATHDDLRPELVQAFNDFLDSGQFILGSQTELFEQEFAAYCQTSYCVGVGNGLDALTIILKVLGISAGDEVIVPSNTFIATWLSVVECGAIPVPVEPDPVTFNIDPSQIQSAITDRTRAIVPVHLYGRPADMSEILALGKENGLFVVEDAAQSHGAEYYERRSGSLAIAGAFSFYPAKNLGALGDGGAITTSDAGLYEKLLKYRNYGSTQKYKHETLGVNSRLDELQAAFLRIKLRHLDKWNEKRRRVARQYITRLSNIKGLQVPQEMNHLVPAWHLFVIAVSKREKLADSLKQRGIETMVHYPASPMFQQAFSDQFQNASGQFRVTRQLQDQVLSLPIGPHLSESDVDYVCDEIIKVMAG